MMKTLRTSARSWRLMAVLALAITAAFGAAPSTANATFFGGGVSAGASINVGVRIAPVNYTGWTYMQPTQTSCGCEYGYRWGGRGWATTRIGGGWVYVAPYSGRQRWAYTAQTGWIVVGGGQFRLY